MENRFIFTQAPTWTLAPQKTRSMAWWVLRVLGQGLNQSARIFFTRVFSGCYAVYNPALF